VQRHAHPPCLQQRQQQQQQQQQWVPDEVHFLRLILAAALAGKSAALRL
jgi:hypothetical protein